MSAISTYADDPCWLPHRYDQRAQEIELIKVTPERFAATEFLADHNPPAASQHARIPLDQFVAAKPEHGPVHFIFHTAFCRSTLLARALNIAGVARGMSEPGIFASLAGNGKAGAALAGPVLQWLGRPTPDGEMIFAKPTNHSNALVPAIMQSHPQSRAIVMSNSLKSFLKSVNARGLLGRNWARKLYLEVQQYAPLDLGMSGAELFALSDMQAAELA